MSSLQQIEQEAREPLLNPVDRVSEMIALGRYAGYGSWKTGIMMVGLGTLVVAVVIALGG
jgi:hypothetical protein